MDIKRKNLEQIQLFEKKLNNMYCIADYLKETRTEVEKQKCNPYIVETFAYIESMLEILTQGKSLIKRYLPLL